MILVNDITAEAREHALTQIHSVFNKMDAVIKNKKNSSNPFLFDTNEITSIDITFASFCFPILLPEETKHLFTSINELDELLLSTGSCNKLHKEGCHRLLNVAKELIEKYESARFVMNLYKHHRYSN